MKAKPITVGSLFSGIGGFELGFEMAGGFEIRWQVENDPYAIRVLERHWPDVPRFHDVRKFCRRIYDCEPETEGGEVLCPRCEMDFGDCECMGTDQVLDEWGWVDLVCGGDPCQENSNARQTESVESPSLGGEFIRIIDELRPRLVLRENPSRVRPDAPWPWRRFRRELEQLGYAVLPFRVRACCVGADHQRDRLFLLAELSDTVQTRLQGDEFAVVAGAARQKGMGDAARRNRWHATPQVCRGADGIPNRVDRLRCLGNAVVPQVVKLIAERIRREGAA